MDKTIQISQEQLTEWVSSLLHMNHHGTLVNRELSGGDLARAAELTERARKRAWKMLNEMYELGAEKPDGYCEPNT